MNLSAPSWTRDQDRVLCAYAALSSVALAKKVSEVGPPRTPGAVRDRIKRLRKVGRIDRKEGSKAWSEAELAILKRCYPTMDDGEIVAVLQQAGFTRSREGVTRARQRNGLVRQTDPEEQEVFKGWHSERGTREDRDTKFVRSVLTEAYRLGLYRKPASITHEPLKALAGEVGA